MAIFPPGRVAALASLVLLALPGPAAGRVISYAPLTARPATPAVQRRTNRHALLIERVGVQTYIGGGPVCGSCGYSSPSRLVLHDSLGQEEPRDVTPGGADTGIDFSAAREEPGFPPVLLAHTTASLFAGENPTSQSRFLFSADGGATWSVLPLPSAGAYAPWSADIGGPFVHARDSAIRVGTAESPFLLALFESDTQRLGLWDVFANASVARRAFASSNSSLIGTDAEGGARCFRELRSRPSDRGRKRDPRAVRRQPRWKLAVALRPAREHVVPRRVDHARRARVRRV